MASSSEALQRKDVTTYLAVAFAAMALVYLRDFQRITPFAMRWAELASRSLPTARNLGGRYLSLIGGAFLLASALAASAPAVSALVGAVR